MIAAWQTGLFRASLCLMALPTGLLLSEKLAGWCALLILVVVMGLLAVGHRPVRRSAVRRRWLAERRTSSRSISPLANTV